MKAKDAITCAWRGDVDFFKTVAPDILLKARNRRDESVLTVAALEGHLDCCEVIVERCTPLLYHQDKYNKWSVLHEVVVADNNVENIMRFLITADSKPDLERGGGGAKIPNHRLLTMQTSWGSTALHFAVGEGNHGATKLLLEADRDFELLRMVDEDGQTCLHFAAKYGDHVSAELILKASPDIEFLKMREIKLNQTALHVAAEKGNLETVKLICDADPDKQLLSMSDSQGNTPLHLALKNSNLEIVRILIDGDVVNDYRANNSNKTPLLMAMDKAAARDASGSGGGGEIPNKRLLTMQTISGKTALHEAVEYGNHGATKVLLEADYDLELLPMVDEDGRTCLHLAAEYGDHVSAELMIKSRPDIEFLKMTERKSNQTALHIAVGKKSLAIVQLLLEAGHSNDLLAMVDSNQQTTLHVAAKTGNLDMVKLMCKAGLDKQLLSMPDYQGNTPLHFAAGNSNLEIVKLLIEGEMVIDYCANNSNQTPLLLAISKAAQDGPGSDSEEICNLLLMRKSSQRTKCTGGIGWTPLHYAVSYGFIGDVEEISRLCPNYIWAEDSHGQIPYVIATRRVLSDERKECLKSDLEIIRILLEKDSKQCTNLEDKHDQPFIHVVVKLGLNDVVETILKSKEMEATILNIQDKDGNTPLHIAALGKNKRMMLCLLYDERVSKEIENNKKEKAIDLINFPYDEAKARVYSLGHQSDLKDQSSFDLLVAALIATVSFTAGLTVPGGYVSDGVNKGSAILLKATTFKVFVVSNNIALLFSLYTIFLNFSTRRLLKKGDIYYESKTGTFRTRLLRKTDDMIYSLNAVTLCTLSAIYAMVVAFITGSYAVLANSDGLAITVCVSSSFFLILASHATWTMAMQYWHSKLVPEVSS